MKKIFNNRLFLVLFTAVVCSSFSVYATIYYEASQINYKGTTLDHAIDDLYSEVNKDILTKLNLSGSKFFDNATYGGRTQSRSTTLNVNKGSYIVVGIFGWSSPGNTTDSNGYIDSTIPSISVSDGICNRLGGKRINTYASSASMFMEYATYVCKFNSNQTISMSRSFSSVTANNAYTNYLAIDAIKLD